MYPDNNVSVDAFEVIEIEHSDDGGGSYNENEDSLIDNTLLNTTDNIQSSTRNNCSPEIELEKSRQTIASPQNTEQNDVIAAPANTVKCSQASPAVSLHSNRSSPLLTPLVALANGGGQEKKLNAASIEEPLGNGQSSYADDKNSTGISSNKPQPQPAARNTRDIITYINANTNSSVSSVKTTPTPAAIETMSDITRRKAMPTPFPVLTPINDPIELYCLSLVDSLRSMPRAERERVKYEFAKILKDAKYTDES